MNMEEFLFDKRLVERNIRAGLVTREQYDAYLAKLADVAAKGEALSIGEDADSGTAAQPVQTEQ